MGPSAVIFRNIILALIAAMLLLMVTTTRHFAFMPGIAGIIGLAGLLFSEKIRPDWPRRLGALLLAFIVLGLLSSLWSINPPETLERAFKIGGVFLGGWVFIAFCLNYPLERLRHLLPLVPVLLLLVSLVLLIEIIFDLPLFRLLHANDPNFINHRIKKYEINKETTALILFLPAGLTMAFSRWGRAGVLVLMAPVLLLLLQTVSQSAQMAFIVALLAFALFNYFPGNSRLSWKIAAGSLVAGLWAAPFIAPLLFRHFAEFFRSNRLLIESSASPRLEIWDFIGWKILESPFTGYGMHATRFIEDFETARIYYHSDTIMHPHNLALQLWLEFGIIGAVAGTAAIILLLLFCRKATDHASRRLYFTVFCSVFFISLVGWDLWQAWWQGLVFAVSGITILAARFHKVKEA